MFGNEEKDPEVLRKEKLARQLNQTVCICKGINLGAVLKGLKDSETVAEVNRKVGTGSGGCQGRRCGPRIKALLKRMQNQSEKSSDSNPETTERSDEE